MLISFSVQVPPAATLFLFGFGIDHPCARRRLRACLEALHTGTPKTTTPLHQPHSTPPLKLEVWTPHVSVHKSQHNSAGLTVSHGFALFCAAEYRTWRTNCPTSATPVSDSVCSWLEREPAAYLKHISMEKNPAAKCSREKWPEKVRPHHIFHIRDSNVTLSHSWGWYLMPLPSPWNGYHHQIPQIPFVPVSNFW